MYAIRSYYDHLLVEDLEQRRAGAVPGYAQVPPGKDPLRIPELLRLPEPLARHPDAQRDRLGRLRAKDIQLHPLEVDSYNFV